ncbi:hypothetical protein MmarC5_0944 [Methanococcus maripaludis C5]|uniref:Uncharacterized protein n=1 Tax=Methanococcus maripaludis (strain C5 / ATCC BAA-1333) TaxID=402880 RepID=A4FYG6_METM5|nr:hypothetical protein [Methanococcus maripaludis]ABO35250.1 hypothetical protein MmarC5_0944 [Methanococcus maripaludis C5]
MGSKDNSNTKNELIKSLLSSFKLNNDNNPEYNPNLSYFMYESFLISLVEKDEDILQKIDSEYLIHSGIVTETIEELKKDETSGKLKKKSYNEFKRRLNQKIDKFNQNEENYTAYIPLNVKISGNINTLTLKNAKIEIKKSNDEEISEIFNFNKIKIEEFEQELTDMNPHLNFEKFVFEKQDYIKITISGKDKDYILDKCNEYAKIFLGIISCAGHRSRPKEYFPTITYFLIFLSNEKNIMDYSFLQNQFIAYMSNRTLLSPKFREIMSSKDYRELNKPKNVVIYKKDIISNINVAFDLINNFSETWQIFLNSLFLNYYKGTISTDVSESFRYFWTVLELGSCRNNNDTHKDLIEILKSQFYELTQAYKELYKLVYDSRHENVHEGLEVNPYSTHLLHWGITIFLDMLLKHMQYANSKEELRLIHGYMRENTENLEKKRETSENSQKYIDYVLDIKRKAELKYDEKEYLEK